MSSLPLVTVVTPSFNQASFIRATIESVLSQDYPNLEYIVMDGGSTDGTEKIVREYGDRVHWISEKDRGQSHAINKGFQMARGSIVAWLNSDDVFLPGAITHAVNGLMAHPSWAAVYGEGYVIDEQGAIVERFPITEPFNLWKLVHMSDYILQQTVFMRRSVLEEIGWVNEDLHYAMDWDLWIRIGLRYEIGYVPQSLGALRVYSATKTSTGGFSRVTEIAKMLAQYTGRKYAPGVIIYGLDTYRAAVTATIRRWVPLVGGLVAWPVNILFLYVIGWNVLRAQGWYRDRWVDRCVRLMVPSRALSIIVKGWVPARRQEAWVVVEVDGVETQVCQVRGGAFRLDIPLPSTGGARYVLLHMQKFGWVPRPRGRKRYARIDKLEYTWPAGVLDGAEMASAGR